eukprot:gene1511-biopygen12466
MVDADRMDADGDDGGDGDGDVDGGGDGDGNDAARRRRGSAHPRRFGGGSARQLPREVPAIEWLHVQG